MTGEFTTPNETHPTIGDVRINSRAKGFGDIAKTLGAIANKSMEEAQNYASDASKANLLQSHSMLQDVEAQSKVEMAKSPGHAPIIAKHAEDTIQGLVRRASLNKADRRNLEYMAQSTSRSLTLSAAKQEIALSRESAKYNTLSSFATTLQSIRQDIFNNPDQAETLIEAQYDAIKGQVQAGIITAVEGANLHKQFDSEMRMAQEIVQGMKEGVLTASDLSTWHATDTGQVPLSNAHLPMDSGTSMNSNHHFGMLTLNDIESRIANGERVAPRDLISIKNISDLDKVLNYGTGAARATGDINSGTSWVALTHKLDVLKKTEKLSTYEEGYKNRLNNFINKAKEPGWYQNFIAGTPEGARMNQDFAQTQSAIENDVPFGTPTQVALNKYMRSTENLNNLISKSDSLGIGMHIPDYLRQPIPLQVLAPITNAFEKGGDIQSAVTNIQMLTPKNRAYAMNAFPATPDGIRKQLTVYEVGALEGKAEGAFITKLFQSQQTDMLGKTESAKNKPEKLVQLDQSKEGKSDRKLIAELRPALTTLTNYLRLQPQGDTVVSAKYDQALRYIKKEAADNGDYMFKNSDLYIEEFRRNMEAAYSVKAGYNYALDTNVVPLEDGQLPVLTAHALNVTRQKLLEYRTPEEVESYFSQHPPILVSAPGGRITVIDPQGYNIPDKYGHPAYDELYSEDTWRSAEYDLHTTNEARFLQNRSVLEYIRAPANTVRPLVEGTVNLENRPKVWNKEGTFSVLKPITLEEEGKTVLIPSIVRGKELSKKEAIAHYKNTREHLGVFRNQKEADAYKNQLMVRNNWGAE